MLFPIENLEYSFFNHLIKIINNTDDNLDNTSNICLICLYQNTKLDLDFRNWPPNIIFFKKDKIAVNLTLDFFQRPPIRQMFLTGTKKSLKWDYYKNTVTINDYALKKSSIKKFGKFNRNKMFLDQTKFFFKLIKNKKIKNVSDIDNAIEAVKLSEKIKKN